MKGLDPNERHLLLEGIFLKFGYDFRGYAVASFDRRLHHVMERLHFASPLTMLAALYDNEALFAQVLPLLTINTTSAFRDPEFYQSLRSNVLPVLHTYPHSRIWVCGCSTGEELYSLAILLKEEGLTERTTVFATDINPRALNSARDGIYSLETIQNFSKNYVAAGGKHSPSEYYTADYGLARMDPGLRHNVVFSQHNLVIDQSFTEAHLILCRNVMIYFSRELQDKVYWLFHSSLAFRGFLALGSKESLRFSDASRGFSAVDADHKIYQKEPVEARLRGVR